MVLSVVNQKGGTGKTTTALNLGAALARLHKSVLLIDMDPQGSLSYSLGVTDPKFAITHVLEGTASLKEAVISVLGEGLDLVPSSIALADLELNLVHLGNRTELLKSAIEGADDYDYIIIDCPPTLSLLTINALSASRYVIIPLQLEVLSIRGLDQIIASIDRINASLNHDLEILGILPVMVDRRKKLSREVYDYIQASYNVPLFEQQIRINVRISEAPSFAQSVLSYSPTSHGAADYQTLAQQIVNHKNKSKRK